MFTSNIRGQLTNKAYAPGVIVSSLANHDSTLATFTYDPNETVKIIVLFKSSPLSLLKSKSAKQSLDEIFSSQVRIESEHASFRNDLIRIESNGISLPKSIFKGAGSKIVFEYKTALNGTALITKRWVARNK